MAELKELLARVEAATGPDRELDFDLFRFLNPVETYQPQGWIITRYIIAPAGTVHAWSRGVKHVACDFVPTWTASIDAALALVEKVLPSLNPPGNCWGIEYANGLFDAHVSRNYVDTTHWLHQAEHRTAPLAALAALLRALTPGSPS